MTHLAPKRDLIKHGGCRGPPTGDIWLIMVNGKLCYHLNSAMYAAKTPVSESPIFIGVVGEGSSKGQRVM